MKKKILCFRPHVCTFTKSIEKEFREAYSKKWITYRIDLCICGRTLVYKVAGTIDIKDIPTWAFKSHLTNKNK